MENKSKLVADLKEVKWLKSGNKPMNEKPPERQPEAKRINMAVAVPPVPAESLISQERLQEAVIWSEILGKPLSKRRKRR
jgi:hypothetical protein